MVDNYLFRVAIRAMRPEEILARFDAEMRADPPAEEGTRVERDGTVVRLRGETCTVLYSRLDDSTAPDAVARETAYFQSLGREVEWKLYGHDRPASLASLLARAGYVPDPPETFLAFDLDSPLQPGVSPPGLEIRPVADVAGLEVAASVSVRAFGPPHGWHAEEYKKRLHDPSLALFVAYLDGAPVASARLEMPRGRSFASLWGGGTSPEYQGRGIYRTLVARRAEVARAHGYRFLTVDALPTSRPILGRLGFAPLDTVTGWVRKPG